MLQGFYWDSYADTRWTRLESHAKELGNYFDLVWIPNSGFCSTSNNMGYLPLYYWRYRMHLNLEDLIKADDFNNKVTNMIKQGGR